MPPLLHRLSRAPLPSCASCLAPGPSQHAGCHCAPRVGKIRKIRKRRRKSVIGPPSSCVHRIGRHASYAGATCTVCMTEGYAEHCTRHSTSRRPSCPSLVPPLMCANHPSPWLTDLPRVQVLGRLRLFLGREGKGALSRSSMALYGVHEGCTQACHCMTHVRMHKGMLLHGAHEVYACEVCTHACGVWHIGMHVRYAHMHVRCGTGMYVRGTASVHLPCTICMPYALCTSYSAWLGDFPSICRRRKRRRPRRLLRPLVVMVKQVCRWRRHFSIRIPILIK